MFCSQFDTNLVPIPRIIIDKTNGKNPKKGVDNWRRTYTIHTLDLTWKSKPHMKMQHLSLPIYGVFLDIGYQGQNYCYFAIYWFKLPWKFLWVILEKYTFCRVVYSWHAILSTVKSSVPFKEFFLLEECISSRNNG